MCAALFIVLATQPAGAANAAHPKLNLPEQRTGSAAGLPHRAASAIGKHTLSKSSPKAPATMPGAVSLSGTRQRAAAVRKSFSAPQGKTGVTVMPPASVRAARVKGRQAAAVAPADTGTGDPELPGPLATGTEVVQDRTADTSVFENADGTLTARVYSRPVHYRAADGSWQDIDTALQQTADGRWAETADAPSASFAATGDDSALVSYGPSPDEQVSYGLQGGSGVVGQASGSSVSYRGIAPSSDLTYEAIASGVKETLTLHSASAPTTWVFPLHLSGLSASLAADGSVEFTDASGQVAETIPHGFMEDSNLGAVSNEGAISTGVTYDLTTTSDGAPALRVSLDQAWLRSSDRVFPVVVDPTNLNASSSTYVETPYDINFSTDDTLKVGSYDGGSHKANSYLMFGSFGSTFQNDYIEGAWLYLDDVWSGGCTAEPVDVHAITSAWSVGSVADYPGLSYGSKIGSSSFEAGASCGGSAWHGINIGDNPSAAGVKLLEGWAHGGTNRGLALTASTSVVAAWKQFASVHSSYPPYLSVTYSSYGASYDPASTYTEPTASTTGSMKVTVTNLGATSWSSSIKLAADLYTTSWSKISTGGAPVAVPSTVGPNSSITMTGTIPAIAPGQYYLCWDMLNGTTSFYATYGVPETCVGIASADTPPQIDSASPPSDAVVDSVAPQFFASGDDPDNYPGNGLTYDFQIYTNPLGGNPALVADSGWVANGQWVAPVGKLAWNQSYFWVVADSDGDAASDWSNPASFSTTVPQPLITSHLGSGANGSGGQSFDPQVGNYTTSATDASIPVTGLALDVVRTYNSLDPRTSSLFGTGWSSRYDMTVQPDNDSSGGMAVTGADGRQERFGLNSFELNQIAGISDQTGDGIDDAVAVDQTTGRLWLYRGPDYSPLTRMRIGSAGWNGIAWLTGGDYNHDGIGDVEGVQTSDGTLWMYPGIAGGGLGARVKIGSAGWNSMKSLALIPPLGSDGKKDLVAVDASTGYLWSYPVNTDGTLGTRFQIGSPGWNGIAEVIGGDFNGDGHGDVVGIQTDTSGLWLYPGTGSNTLGARVQIGTGWNQMQDLAAVRGISGDATADILATQKSSGIRYLYHSGAAFGAGSSYAGGTRTVTAMAVYTPAAGEFETLSPAAGSNLGWALADKSGTTYTFGRATGSVWKLTKITDRHGRGQSLIYRNDGTDSLETVVDSVSGRSLYFQWGSEGHITQVATDPATTGGTAEIWRYTYSGDELTQVCPPTSTTACTTYSYTSGSSSGSHLRSAVLDANPSSYWRLADTSGTSAASSVALNEGNDNGTYSATGITLGGTGPLPGSPTTAPTFDGSHGYVSLPNGLLSSASYVSIGLWFKSTSTAAGVLFSYQKDALTKTSTPGTYTPALYLGTSGKLYGQLVDGQASTPMATSWSVADGNWHYALLSGAGDSESLYVDGTMVSTQSGQISVSGQLVDAIGDGFIGGQWPDEPHLSTTANTGYPAYFKGQIAEVAFYTHALGAPAVAQQYQAGANAAYELTGITLPSGKTRLTATYDPVRDRASQITDGNGGTWKVGVPSTSGSSAYYRAEVASSQPYNYWRLTDSSGSDAANENSDDNLAQWASGPGTYHNVTLGAAGPFIGSSQTAATFDGTSSYLSVPDDFVLGGPDNTNFSIELWFKTTSTGETIFSYQSGPIGTALAGGYTPALYVGADGHLYGELWDGFLSPMESTAKVNDGKWHQAVITAGSDNDQTLSLDGQQTDTRSGTDLNFGNESYVYLGAGYLSGNWPSQPAANPQGYFKGSLAEISEYASTLDSDTIAAHFSARGSASGAAPVTTVSVTDPGNHSLTYRSDPGHSGRLLSTTDALGGTTSYGYDDNGFQATTTDPDGVRTSLTNNARGDVLSRTTSDSHGETETGYYTYPADGAYIVTDPRNDEPTAYADPRSSGPTDTTYATTYTYSTAGDPLSTTDPDADATINTYTDGSETAVGGGTEPPGLVKTAKDPNGHSTTYLYDRSGDLAQITSPSGLTTKYTYDLLGRRTTATQISDTYPAGVTTSWTYDDDNRPLTVKGLATTDAVSGTTHTPQATYTYDDDGNTLSQAVSDTTGGDTTRTTKWAYNSQDQLLSVTDPAGNTTSYGYDSYGNRNGLTSAYGAQFQYTYSPNGELLTTTMTNYTGDPVNPSPATSLVLESRAYDPAGLLASRTDSMGRTTDFDYYGDERLADSWLDRYHNPDGTIDSKNLVSYDYDAAGNVTDAYRTDDRIRTQYIHDPAGRVTQTSLDPSRLNIVTSNAYDKNGNILSQSVTDGTTTEQTDQSYDTLGDVTSTTVHNGATGNLVTTHTYDQRSVLTSTTDPRGNVSGAAAADYTANFASDQAGRLTQVTAPVVSAESNGGPAQQVHPITLYGYDSFGDQTAVDDPDGNITTYTYDADSRQVAVSAPAYTPPGASTAITPTITGQYDGAGNLTDLTDALGATTHYTYDQFGDVAQVREPAVDGTSPTTHLIYDTDSELLQVTDPTGAVSTSTYDDLGRNSTSTQVVRQPTPTADTTTYGYDGAGNLTSVTQPGGEKSTASYDPAGNLGYATDPLGNSTTYIPDVAGRTTKEELPDGSAHTWTYDLAGRLTATATLDPSGAKLSGTSAEYNADGNPTSVTDADSHTTTYQYNALDNPVQQTEPVTNTSTITTSFGYDAAGNATRSTDGNRNATISTYNALGLPESVIEPTTSAFPNAADRTTTVAYDRNGQPVTTTRPGGTTLTNTYDADGRLTAQTGTGAEGATADRAIGYDANSRVTSISAPHGSDTYTYDDRGDLLTAAGPSGTAAYTYNADEELASRTDKAGTAAYTYDADGRLRTASDPLTGTTLTYGYNKLSQLTDVSYGTNAADLSLGYDAQHRLDSDTLKAPGGTTEASTAYGYDPAGRVTTQTTTGTAGAGTESYGYDQAGRLTSWTQGAATTAYGYDDAGNRTSVTTGSTTTAATYNARDQLTGINSNSSTTTYAYTPRGTLSTVTGPAGTESLSYDAFDQLTADGTTTYTHDGLGRLASAGNSTFSYDGTDSQIVSDGTETYDRAPDNSSLLAVSGPGGAALAYSNQHGDLTATFTATGTALAGSTAYDPYGQTTAASGTLHDLGYQGGWTDPATHRVATASRWYDPTTGGFTSHDSTSQAPVPSVAANPYAYGNDDPMDNADPSGDSACGTSYQPTGGYAYHHHYGTPSPGNPYGYNYPPGMPDGTNYGDGSALNDGSASSHAGSSPSVVDRIRGAVGSVNSSVSSSLGGGNLGKVAGAAAAAVVLGGMVALAGYGSCDVGYTAPPPPPPTAEMGVHENPGARPTGPSNGPGTHTEPGTKTAADGPGVTAPTHSAGTNPTVASSYHPTVNGVSGISPSAASMTAAPSGALGTALPIDPTAGADSTLVTPADPTAGLPNTLTTPIDSAAGLPETLTTPAKPHTGLGSTAFPADPRASDPSIAMSSADAGTLLPTYVWRPGRHPAVDGEEQGPLTEDQIVRSGASATAGSYLFVQKLDGSVLAMNYSLYDDDSFDGMEYAPGHTTLAGGLRVPVLFAGGFTVDSHGRVLEMDTGSGHYQPGSYSRYNEADYARLEDVAAAALRRFGLVVDENTVWRPWDVRN